MFKNPFLTFCLCCETKHCPILNLTALSLRVDQLAKGQMFEKKDLPALARGEFPQSWGRERGGLGKSRSTPDNTWRQRLQPPHQQTPFSFLSPVYCLNLLHSKSSGKSLHFCVDHSDSATIEVPLCVRTCVLEHQEDGGTASTLQDLSIQ